MGLVDPRAFGGYQPFQFSLGGEAPKRQFPISLRKPGQGYVGEDQNQPPPVEPLVQPQQVTKGSIEDLRGRLGTAVQLSQRGGLGGLAAGIGALVLRKKLSDLDPKIREMDAAEEKLATNLQEAELRQRTNSAMEQERKLADFGKIDAYGKVRSEHLLGNQPSEEDMTTARIMRNPDGSPLSGWQMLEKSGPETYKSIQELATFAPELDVVFQNPVSEDESINVDFAKAIQKAREDKQNFDYVSSKVNEGKSTDLLNQQNKVMMLFDRAMGNIEASDKIGDPAKAEAMLQGGLRMLGTVNDLATKLDLPLYTDSFKSLALVRSRPKEGPEGGVETINPLSTLPKEERYDIVQNLVTKVRPDLQRGMAIKAGQTAKPNPRVASPPTTKDKTPPIGLGGPPAGAVKPPAAGKKRTPEEEARYQKLMKKAGG